MNAPLLIDLQFAVKEWQINGRPDSRFVRDLSHKISRRFTRINTDQKQLQRESQL